MGRGRRKYRKLRRARSHARAPLIDAVVPESPNGGAVLEWKADVARERWTIAPALGWFALLLIGFLIVVDGELDALTGLLIRSPAEPTVAGPVLGGGSRPLADTSEPALPPVPDLAPSEGRSGAVPASVPGKTIEDVCIPPVPASGGCERWSMDGFYAALAAVERGAAAAPARVAFFGDSVSASDDIPGRLRARLQAAFGDGGAGFVHAVAPHRFNHHRAIDRRQSGTWRTWDVALSPIADRLYGVGLATAEGAGRITLTSRASAAPTRFELYYLAQPGGGAVAIEVDGAPVATVDTAAERKESRFYPLTLTGGRGEIALITSRGKVRLFGAALERTAGVVVDNLALVSGTAKNFLNNLASHWRNQLAHRAPDLVVIMLGTNEAQWLAGARAMSEYQRHWEALLAPVRAAQPRGACLVMSPLDQAEIRDDRVVPRQVGRMVAAQRAAARAAGCAYWDTYTWMGGAGAAIKWNRRGLLGSDFAHTSRQGAARVADGLADAIFAGYKSYKSR